MTETQNNIGNFKGVMLCNRPNEALMIEKDRPFISRVDHKQQIGINPIRRIFNIARKRNYLTTLKKHREWLEDYKNVVKARKDELNVVEIQAQEKFQKIRQMAANDRVKTKQMKKEFDEMRSKVLSDLNIADKPKYPKTQLTANNLEKLNEESISSQKKNKKEKEKPKWAMTEKEIEFEDEKECDDLLDFAKNLDYENYLADLEIKSLVKSLKERIDNIKDQNISPEKAEENVIDKEKEEEEEKEKLEVASNSDNIEVPIKRIKFEETSQAGSIRSKKSIQSIRSELEKKEKEALNNPDWDRTTTLSQQKMTLEEKIAKQVAEEILSNYKPLKQIHSNQSIRKILEAEARKHLERNYNINGPKITVIHENLTGQKRDVVASNLPYLHRNPAV